MGTKRAPLEVLFLNDADIVACDISVTSVCDAVRAAFQAKANGRAATGHHLGIVADPQLDFKAKGGVLHDAGFAAMKWYGFAAQNAAENLPNFMPVIVLNELSTGAPVAIMDGHWISGVRTAAISAVAAQVLASSGATSIGFVGAGVQAAAHLAALRALFPIQRVTAYTPSGQGAQRLVESVRLLGLDARAVTDPRAAVQEHDIVVTSIPRTSSLRHYLDGAWVATGSFVSMVDLGAAWNRQTLGAFDLMITDYLDPTTHRPIETLNYDGDYAGDIGAMLNTPPARPGARRSGLIFAGSGLADVAVASLVYQRALAMGAGQRLQL
jgi:ornithine cyclodeaminase/alanine dehydrogenase-like protein (mu-crystallin family)